MLCTENSQTLDKTISMRFSNKHDWEQIEGLFKEYMSGSAPSVRPVFEFLENKITMHLRAKGLNSEDVAEVSQDTLIKIHRFRNQYNPTKPLRAWIYTISDRTVIDFWRRNSRHKNTTLLDENVSETIENNPQRATENRQVLQKIDNKIKDLKPVDKMIVDMLVHDGKSMSEIATETGLSALAVKMRLFRLRQVLKTLMILILIVRL